MVLMLQPQVLIKTQWHAKLDCQATYLQSMVWNRRRFFHIPYWQFSSIPFSFHTYILIFHSIFQTILKFSFPYSILYFHTKMRLDGKLRIIATSVMLCVGSPYVFLCKITNSATRGWKRYNIETCKGKNLKFRT